MTTPPPAQPVYQSQPVSPSDEKTWSVLAHIGGIILYWIGPLIVFLVYKDRSTTIRQNSLAALNFQLTLFIAYIVGWILTIVFVGFLILAAAGILSLIFGIMGAIAANEGRPYTYPFAIAFVK